MPPPSSTADLRLCGVADLDLAPESVDLILTDPPYPREFLPLWAEFGILAGRMLRPGGSLLAMSGQAHLPKVMEHLCGGGLTYAWTIQCATSAPNTRIWPRRMWSVWKPILWYTKGAARPQRWIEDRVVSRASDKRLHHWGQDLSVFIDLALAFSKRGDRICDPFLGGGTTAAAALLTGRRFVGCDIDPDCLRKTEARLGAVGDYLRTNRERVLS